MNYKIKHWYGRIGNNLFQVCNAIHAAKKTKGIFELDLTHSFIAPCIHDFSEESDNKVEKEDTFVSEFFWLKKELPNIESPSWAAYRSLFLDHVSEDLYSKLGNEKNPIDLVIHVRSGDVFGKLFNKMGLLAETRALLRAVWRKLQNKSYVHPGYPQPPLAFYELILNSRHWENVVLVAEDKRNPVIDKILQRYPNVKYKKQNFEADLEVVLHAKNLVIGQGAFGLALALANRHIEGLFCPTNAWDLNGLILSGKVADINFYAYEMRNYLYDEPWTASRKQKQLMVSYDIANIRKA